MKPLTSDWRERISSMRSIYITYIIFIYGKVNVPSVNLLPISTFCSILVMSPPFSFVHFPFLQNSNSFLEQNCLKWYHSHLYAQMMRKDIGGWHNFSIFKCSPLCPVWWAEYMIQIIFLLVGVEDHELLGFS